MCTKKNCRKMTLKTTNNNYKKHQKVNKKIENYLKIIIQTDKKVTT